MMSTLTKAVFPLFDCDAEEGCFAVVPGAHKSNFPRPWGNHPDENPSLVAVPARAGDAIIFTEALAHGSMVCVSGKLAGRSKIGSVLETQQKHNILIRMGIKMTEVEQYEFDRQGYIVIKNMLAEKEVDALRQAVDALENHAKEHVDEPPRKVSAWGATYHVNAEKGYHVQGSSDEGKTLIVEDFWNADLAFDVLLDHEGTMDYVHGVVRGRPTINNSEIRIRYKGNASRCHGGMRPDNGKYRYGFSGRIDCMMVRMVYFVHDVTNEQGAFCVVPGTHKGNLACPYENDPDTEPGMMGLEVNAGDAIFFTEHLRHGGLTNRSDQVRKTVHVGYGPYWMMSQNIATMDEPQFITDETIARYTAEQRSLFRPWPEKI